MFKKTRIRSKSPLTPMQEGFIRHLLSDPNYNATEAARAAGYKQPGLVGNKLMQHPEVRRQIKRAQHKRNKKVEVKAEEVLRELLFSVKRDPADYCDEDGNILSVHKMPRSARRAIDGIKQRRIIKRDRDGGETETVITELKLTPKLQAVELAMKHIGIIAPDKHLHSHDHRLSVNWEDYYKSRNDNQDVIQNKLAFIEQQQPASDNEPPPVLDAEYTVKELMDDPPADG